MAVVLFKRSANNFEESLCHSGKGMKRCQDILKEAAVCLINSLKKKIGLRKGQRKFTFSGGIGSILWSNGQKSFYKMLTNEEKANNVHMKASPHPACPTYIGINAGSLKGRHQDREGNTIRSALPNYTQVPFHKLTKFHNETHKMFDNW